MTKTPWPWGLISSLPSSAEHGAPDGLTPAPCVTQAGPHVACLAVSMKYANELPKEVLGEHLSSRLSKSPWLPEVLTLWFFPVCGDSFSRAGLPRARERWGLRESNAFFLFSAFIFLVHKSVAPANGRLAEVAAGWLAAPAWCLSHSDRWITSSHAWAAWPAPSRRPGSTQYGWHVLCFPTACHMEPAWRLWQSTAGWPGSLGSEREKLVLY